MAYGNNVSIQGYLNFVELKYTNNGKPFTTGSISWRKKTNDKTENMFFNFVMYGEKANSLVDYNNKMVKLIGHLESGKTNTGTKFTKIVCFDFTDPTFKETK